MDFDVVVVGAGPAGAVAARELARAGAGSILLLDQQAMPRVKPCAGGLSPFALRDLAALGLLDDIEKRAHTLDSLRLVGPSARVAAVRTSLAAWVLPRAQLDELLVRAATRAGAVFRAPARVDGLVERNGRVVGVRCGEETIRCHWAIVAAGATTKLRWDERPPLVLDTCMTWFEDLDFVPHRLEMIFDADLAPQYGWLFPESDRRANIGLCLERSRRRGRSVRDMFEAFLDRHFGKRLAGARQLGRWRGHPISATAHIEHHAPRGVLVVGEAGRLTNVATGEGISYAIRSGALAAEAIAHARADDGPEHIARTYEGRLRQSMQWELRLGRWFVPVGRVALDALTRFAQLPWAPRMTRGNLRKDGAPPG